MRDDVVSLYRYSFVCQKGLVQCDLVAMVEVNLYDDERRGNEIEIEIDLDGHISSSQAESWIYHLGTILFLVSSKEICCRLYHDDGGVVAVRVTGVDEEESRFFGDEGSRLCDDEVLEILCG